MLKLILNFLTGGVLTSITGLAKSYFDKEITLERFKTELAGVMLNGYTDIARIQGDVIMAELKGESWLQRNWRALLATGSFASYWFVIIPYPFFIEWGILPAVRFGEVGLNNMFYLTMVCIGGYVGGKSLENITSAVIRYFSK